MKPLQPKANVLFEASWEVCNKAGGIYTVIASKLTAMQQAYDTYIALGPLLEHAQPDFISQPTPAPFQTIFDTLQEKGIECAYGIWDTPSRPTTILIKPTSLALQCNTIKKILWEHYRVDSLFAHNDFDEPVLWAWAVGIFMQEAQHIFSTTQPLLHVHEWLSVASILYLDYAKQNIPTVFTTHATMLGRTLSSQGEDITQLFKTIDPLSKAKALGIIEKHTMEQAGANTADVFTTVSQQAAIEAQHFFSKKPFVLPNGLDLSLFPSFEEASYQHLLSKRQLHQYLIAHFFPHYAFNLEKTLLYYTSGRFEYINKGIDVSIRACAQLNNQLKKEQSETTIIMFYFLALDSQTPRQELLEQQNTLDALYADIRSKKESIIHQLVLDVVENKPQKTPVLNKDFFQRLQREFSSIGRPGNPPLLTHHLQGEEEFIVARQAQELGLYNREEDRVKIVIIPRYLDGRDGLFNMPYYEMVSGCHLGIFPSHYEPWGYTPLESIALGVPAVTTTAAGFAQFISPKRTFPFPGLIIVKQNPNKETLAHNIYTQMESYAHLSKQDRVSQKMKAHTLSQYLDWKLLLQSYIQAHNTALQHRTTQ